MPSLQSPYCLVFESIATDYAPNSVAGSRARDSRMRSKPVKDRSPPPANDRESSDGVAKPGRRTEALGKKARRETEIGGPKGPEPTRYGDWERKGIASDF